MNIDILDKAESLGLYIIETTPDANGYPKNLKKAIIGFEDMESAEKFAKENGLSVEIFKRRAGWQLWYRTGIWPDKPFNMPHVYSDDPSYECFFSGDEESFVEGVKAVISELDDFDLIKGFIEMKSNIWDEFGILGDDEFILVRDGKLDKVLDIHKMHFEYDGTYREIGVI